MPSDVNLTGATRGALGVWPVDAVREFGIDAFVTDRFNGVSHGPYDSLNLADHVGDDQDAVAENRRRVAEAIEVSPDRLVTVRQVHGTATLDARDVTRSSEADAIVTDDAQFALAILVADCLPLVFVDETSSRFAVVHAGWRGLASGIIARSLEHVGTARHVHAFIGPSISMEGYQIGPEVADLFATVPLALIADGGDRSRLDLRQVATTQLMEAGVSGEHIVRSREVTDGGEVFFSDRAQRPCGRFALVAKRAS
jgi:YfiH family protein